MVKTIDYSRKEDLSGLRMYSGHTLPLGATPLAGAVQFSIFSRHARRVWLDLYANAFDAEPQFEVCLSPEHNKTGDYWHVTIEGLFPGQLYLYRMEGDFDPQSGMRFNPHRSLIDPYARAITAEAGWNSGSASAYIPGHPNADLSFSEEKNARTMPKCVVVDTSFDWQGDRPLNHPPNEVIIYESHVRGLTMHKSSSRHNVKHPGTFRGIIEMIPYFQDLGITSLELMPIQEFDEYEYSYNSNPLTGEPLKNYWGYSTLAFFAPKARYAACTQSSARAPAGAPTRAHFGQVHEFKEMVRELHKAGIELILDVVYNHSGEGNVLGPTYSFRGIDNAVYYMLDTNPRFYRNYSGCGNTMNCNNPLVRNLILDSLHYWVQEMHVDGFRFDLASILGRGENGERMAEHSLLEQISADPLLQDTKIIAEPWDAADAYRLGDFPGRWAEWNDRYRDDVKMFWRGDEHKLSAFATRLAGSADLYAAGGRSPLHSINYITSHDGFTLNDLVSYNEKHNEQNGEGNRDGNNHEHSYNYGFEGQTDNKEIAEVRNRMIKNFLATLLLSRGTPMILGGDEMRRSKQGNNNSYCQDNEMSWYAHDLLDKHADVYSFLRFMIRFRKEHLSGGLSDISWYNENGNTPDWNSAKNLLAMKIDSTLLVFFNATTEDCTFTLPPPETATQASPGPKAQNVEQKMVWHRVVDTSDVRWSCTDSDDALENTVAMTVAMEKTQYLQKQRSLALFIAKPAKPSTSAGPAGHANADASGRKPQ